jgi:hypothetical protein
MARILIRPTEESYTKPKKKTARKKVESTLSGRDVAFAKTFKLPFLNQVIADLGGPEYPTIEMAAAFFGVNDRARYLREVTRQILPHVRAKETHFWISTNCPSYPKSMMRVRR